MTGLKHIYLMTYYHTEIAPVCLAGRVRLCFHPSPLGWVETQQEKGPSLKGDCM